MSGKMSGELVGPWAGMGECLAAVRRMVGAHVGSQHATDFVQEACAQMLALPDRDSIRNPKAYLYRAAVNLAYNASARRRREAVAMETLSIQGGQSFEERDPARIYVDRRRLERVARTIDALPPRCREVFVLYRFHGLDQGTIAARLGISRNMVEKHVVRAMQACREALGQES